MKSHPTQIRFGRVGLLALLLASGVVVACEGGQAGDKCSKDSDCNTSLTCQPVEGRDSDYCCPAEGPGQTNENIPDNCKAADAGSGTGTGTGTGMTAEDAATGG